MISEKINYAFNQIESALVAFTSDIRKKFQQVVPNCPVFVMNNGDFSFYTNNKWVKTTNEEIILRTPRLVVKFDDIQMNQQEDTYAKNRIMYLFDSKPFTCRARRKTYTINIQLNMVSPNYVSMLNYFEVFAMFSAKEKVFTYNFLGNTYQASWNIMSHSIENPQQAYDSSTRNVVATYTIELQVHLMVPEIDSIELLDDSSIKGDVRIQYDLLQKNMANELFETSSLNLNMEPEDQREYALNTVNYNETTDSYETTGSELFDVKPAPLAVENQKDIVPIKTEEAGTITEYQTDLDSFAFSTEKRELTQPVDGTKLAKKQK